MRKFTVRRYKTPTVRYVRWTTGMRTLALHGKSGVLAVKELGRPWCVCEAADIPPTRSRAERTIAGGLTMRAALATLRML